MTNASINNSYDVASFNSTDPYWINQSKFPRLTREINLP